MAPTTTWLVTGLDWPAQLSVWLVGPLVVSVQRPGPPRGTSTNATCGLSVPACAPFSALAIATGAAGLAVESVTFEELTTADRVVTVVVRGRAGVVVTSVVACVVTVTRRDVVVGDTPAGGRRGLDAEVRVKTRMSKRIGLDHIKRCALFSEKVVRGIVFEG